MSGDRDPAAIENTPSPEGTRPDVAAILTELREQVRERRRRLTVADPDDPHALNLAELRRSADAVNDTWFVSAHLPVTWDLPVVGRLGAYTKRLVRLLLRWYINPIVEQQNRFNSAVARAITDTYAYQERLTREWQLLEERIAKLEKVTKGLNRKDAKSAKVTKDASD